MEGGVKDTGAIPRSRMCFVSILGLMEGGVKGDGTVVKYNHYYVSILGLMEGGVKERFVFNNL